MYIENIYRVTYKYSMGALIFHVRRMAYLGGKGGWGGGTVGVMVDQKVDDGDEFTASDISKL